MHLTLTGAYGRDYQTADAAIADWDADKDFEIHNPGYGRYINKQQAPHAKKDGHEFVRLRFKKRAEFVDVPL